MGSPPGLRASTIVIGDEILGGFVQDTNSGWLAERLQAQGVPLDRIVTVPDEVEAIDEALATELGRGRPRVVVTSGGLGSTPDDRTMAAVGRHVGVELVVEPTLEARIGAALDRNAAEGTPASATHLESVRKMALVPDGAYLLGGSGFAPGVALDVDGGAHAGGATIVILPGIPSEFRRITEESVEPQLLAGRGRPQHVVELTHPYPESALNPVLEELDAAYPDVHVGSYPGRHCTVRLKGPRAAVEDAAARVRDAVAAVDATPGSAQLRAAWQIHWGADEPT